MKITTPGALLYIEPVEAKTDNPVNDHFTKLAEKLLSGGPALETGILLPTGHFQTACMTKGTHKCSCGEESTNVDYRVAGGLITHALAPHYLRWHRPEVPQRDLDMLRTRAMQMASEIAAEKDNNNADDAYKRSAEGDPAPPREPKKLRAVAMEAIIKDMPACLREFMPDTPGTAADFEAIANLFDEARTYNVVGGRYPHETCKNCVRSTFAIGRTVPPSNDLPPTSAAEIMRQRMRLMHKPFGALRVDFAHKAEDGKYMIRMRFDDPYHLDAWTEFEFQADRLIDDVRRAIADAKEEEGGDSDAAGSDAADSDADNANNNA